MGARVLPAQDASLSPPNTLMTLAEVIETIERQTDHRFIYNASVLDVSMRVSLPVKEASLSEVLNILEPQMGFNTIKKLNYIIIHTAAPYRERYKPSLPQQRTSDRYLPVGVDLAGTASNPRPLTADPTAEPTDNHRPLTEAPETEPPSYSKIISIDRYRTVRERLPAVAIKTNLLYATVALTPNIAIETSIGKRHSIEIGAGHNRWKHKADLNDNEKLLHWIIRPEYRMWMCERYDRHFVGLHAFYAAFNISGKSIPMLFREQYRYEGYALGVGVSYGYHWALCRRWGIEFEAGLGTAYMDYDRFGCKTCERNADRKTETYFGPTRAAVSIVFIIR